MNKVRKTIKKWCDLENVYIKNCRCPPNVHTRTCQQKWAKILELFKLYKTKSSDQFHSVSSEPAEQEEDEVNLEDDDDDDDDLDPGYGGSSPVPDIPDEEALPQEDPPTPGPDQETERVSPVPGTSKDRHPNLHPVTDVLRPTDIHPRPASPSASPDTSAEFYSLNETLGQLEYTLEQLTHETSLALSQSESEAEYQQILDAHYSKVLKIQRDYEDVRTQARSTPSSQPSTSTPVRRSNPFSDVEEVLFGPSTPVRRLTRRQGQVEDIPLPKRPLEYKPLKKK